ncbi:PREDICTED: lysosome-associated membrane glycoprotein 1 [Thamnophis sirtalis]|uniref:Lysosome-associated membrane glycoprotein 1 n=1 Tax=Thamnophis sirtalis TaxID=35019 RepID=A0A6I9XUV9_9SAUR|nr:PREDICTED: lysosome-associated membrane glycoprotein 1 [Thamnophis sirtalis]
MAGRNAVGFLLAAALFGFLQTASSFQVKDLDGKLCLSANFSMRFTVEFETKSHKKQNAIFTLPSDAHAMNVSTCGNQKTPEQILVVGFGKGHSLNMTFEKKASLYVVSELAFKFNLSDSSIFPNSSGGELPEVKHGTDIQADLNTKYVCHSNKSITVEKVSVLLSDVSVEAYVTNDTLSKKDTICYEDKPTSSPITTTHLPSTHIPSTAVTTTSVPPSLKPEVGHYSVNGSSGMCLRASMALQLNLTYSAQNKNVSKVLNIPPNAEPSGKCDNNTVTLNLTSGTTKISFNFAQNSSTEKYFLHGIFLSAEVPSTEKNINATNNSLSALRATIGKSYKCVAEEIIQVSDKAALNIYNVQVQAFKIAGDKFGAVEECQLDENNMLIPIVVGAALAGLVLIVLIAYLIGRKRSHAGYQTI